MIANCGGDYSTETVAFACVCPRLTGGLEGSKMIRFTQRQSQIACTNTVSTLPLDFLLQVIRACSKLKLLFTTLTLVTYIPSLDKPNQPHTHRPQLLQINTMTKQYPIINSCQKMEGGEWRLY